MRNMLKALYFLAIWLPCTAFLQEINSYDAEFSSSTNLGKDIKTECGAFLRMFAQTTQHFNWCAVEHAKPLRFCEKCTKQYTDLLKQNPIAFNDSNCVKDLVKSERFQIVMKVCDFQTGLWREGTL